MIERLLSIPADYTFDEAKTLLNHLGFDQSNKGKTSGSAVKFYRPSDGAVIMFHKPHSPEILKRYIVKDIIQTLKGKGDING